MMKRLAYIWYGFIFAAAAVLAIWAPDVLSLIDAWTMAAVIAVGVLAGLAPEASLTTGLRNGRDRIAEAAQAETDTAWTALVSGGAPFGVKRLDDAFEAYREKVTSQRASGQVLCAIEDYVNERSMASWTARGVSAMIPGTMTALGILGTFVGLLVGVRGAGFADGEQALESVEKLLGGIDVAFYTSIAGVILSILYGLAQRLSWTLLVRELDAFTMEFHAYVIPPVEEQERWRSRSEMKKIVSLLEEMPKRDAFYAAVEGAGSGDRDKVLMEKIQESFDEDRFDFKLQPYFEIATGRPAGAEALMRWDHPELGDIRPSVFMPTVERNGFVTKLDAMVWEKAFVYLREAKAAGKRPFPLSLNVSKTDVLAMDVASFMSAMSEKHQVPPSMIVIELSIKAYSGARKSADSTEKALTAKGFKVVVDGFDGNFASLEADGAINTRFLKLDVRGMDGPERSEKMAEAFAKARELGFEMSVEGVESMDDEETLRAEGCSVAQGYKYSKPMGKEECARLMAGEA